MDKFPPKKFCSFEVQVDGQLEQLFPASIVTFRSCYSGVGWATFCPSSSILSPGGLGNGCHGLSEMEWSLPVLEDPAHGQAALSPCHPFSLYRSGVVTATRPKKLCSFEVQIDGQLEQLFPASIVTFRSCYSGVGWATFCPSSSILSPGGLGNGCHGLSEMEWSLPVLEDPAHGQAALSPCHPFSLYRSRVVTATRPKKSKLVLDGRLSGPHRRLPKTDFSRSFETLRSS